MARPRKGVQTKRAEVAPEVRVQAEAVEFDPLAEDVCGMIRSITVKMALE